MENYPEEIQNDQDESWLRQKCIAVATKVGAGVLAFSTIASGNVHAAKGEAAEIACTTAGDICSWGGNGGFELGNNDDPYVISSTPSNIGLKNVTSVANGTQGGSVAAQADGSVWQWANMMAGTSSKPEKVSGITNAISVAAGSSRYALLADGRVVAWGYNNHGQLGNGTTVGSNTPTEVQGLRNITSIASGVETAYALGKDGSVWAWGNGRDGRLGTGKAENDAQHNNLTPTKVQGLANVKSISASASNGYALRADGTVMAWGTAYNALLGINTNKNAIVPQEIPGLKDIRSLGTNTPSSTEFAIDNSGKAWAWGSGRAGALGDGNCPRDTKFSTPVQVPNVSNVVSISGSERSAFAITSSGEVFGWGYNDQGTLGYGVEPDSCSAPAKILGLGKIKQIAMGNLAVFAIGTGSASLPPTEKPLKYAALGDSYSSGEGAPNPKFINGTDQNNNKCHRSTAAYPNVIYDDIRRKVSSFIFRACSGATIQDFYKSNAEGNKNEPKQLAWLDSKTDLITLTIGGNDVGFGDIMAYCATRYPTYKSCESKYAKATDAKITNLGRASINYTLPKLYASIKSAAPKAQALVLGYPMLFPSKPPKSCATGIGNLKFSQSDMKWMNGESAKLNAVIKKSALAAGFKYVDLQNAFNGHELCTTTPYINRAILDLTSPNILRQVNWSFHPKKSGHAVEARIVEKLLG